MSRQRHFKIFTPRRAGPSLEEMETRFTESENRRLEIFNESMLQQQQEYSDFEKLRREGEKLRSEQFESTMITIDEAFVTNEAHRNKTFCDMETRQEDVFRDNEMSREKRFREREVSRGEGFQQCEDTREKRSEWYAHARHLHVQQGRQIREESCQKLERQMLDQFNVWVRFQEDSFTTAERQRDEIVRETLATREYPHAVHNEIDEEATVSENVPHSSSNSSERSCPDAHADLISVTVYPPSTPRPAAPPLNRSISPSHYQSPVIIKQPPSHDFRRSLSGTRSRSLDRVVIPGPHLLRSLSSERSGSRGSSNDAQSDRKAKSGVTASLYDVPNRHQATCEGHFKESQERQQQEFLMEEKHRDMTFRQAEGTRDEAEWKRAEVFKRHELNRELKSQMATTLRDKRFLRKELTRGWGEEWRRQQFKEAEERRSQLFEQSRSWDQKQYSAMNTLESASLKLMWDKVEKLDNRQRVSFEQAKQRRSAAFSQSQARRENQLGSSHEEISPSPMAPAPPGRIVHDIEPGVLTQPLPTIIQASQYANSIASSIQTSASAVTRSQSRSRSRHRRRLGLARSTSQSDYGHQRRSRRYSPATGFAPQTILMQANLRDPLPVPVKEERQSQSHEQQFYVAQRRRQHAFEKSQSERAKAFENGARSRQQVFNINELKRQQDFEEKQTARREISSEKEYERTINFADAQIEREEKFQEGEENRESNFRKAENIRERAFGTAQASREEDFYSRQAELQNECFESENQRRSDFDIWERRRLELLHQRDQEQRDSYAVEEMQHERIFVEAINAASCKGRKE